MTTGLQVVVGAGEGVFREPTARLPDGEDEELQEF